MLPIPFGPTVLTPGPGAAALACPRGRWICGPGLCVRIRSALLSSVPSSVKWDSCGAGPASGPDLGLAHFHPWRGAASFPAHHAYVQGCGGCVRTWGSPPPSPGGVVARLGWGLPTAPEGLQAPLEVQSPLPHLHASKASCQPRAARGGQCCGSHARLPRRRSQASGAWGRVLQGVGVGCPLSEGCRGQVESHHVPSLPVRGASRDLPFPKSHLLAGTPELRDPVPRSLHPFFSRAFVARA